MKNTALSLVFIVSAFNFVHGQTFKLVKNTSSEIIIKFSLESTLIEKLNSVKTSLTELGFPMLNEKGKPNLPYFSCSVMLPNRGNVSISTTFSDDKSITLDNVLIKEATGNKKRQQLSTSTNDSQEYLNTDYFLPGNLINNEAPFILRELRGQSITVYPFQYKPLTKTLKYYAELYITVKIDESEGKNEIIEKMDNQIGLTIYSNRFINPSKNKYLSKQEDGDLLIIAPLSYKKSIQDLVSWKKQKGVHTNVAYIETIGNSATQIKKFITDQFTIQNTLLYVLLIGDHEATPSFSYGAVDPLYPNDIYWSDSYYGQLLGDDFYPELFVGRIAGSEAEVSAILTKNISYEKNPSPGKWMNEAILIGSSEGKGDGDNGEADWEHLRIIKDTFTTQLSYSKVYEFYDGSKDGLDKVGNPTNNDIISQLNNGSGLILYTGHGSLEKMNTSGFSSADLNALDNENKLPFIISVACDNGKFVNNNCIGELFLKNNQITNKETGAIAFCGSTILMDWAPPMKTQDEIALLINNSSPILQKQTLGGIFWNGQFSMLEKYGQNGIGAMQTWLLFGDPSLTLRFKETKDLPCQIEKKGDAIRILSKENAQIGVSFNDSIITKGKITDGLFEFILQENMTTDSLLITVTLQNHSVFTKYITLNKLNLTGDLTENLLIYPNPSIEVINIHYQNNLFDVCIQDLSGKAVFIKTNCQEDTQIDTSVFKSGIYIIELKTKTEIIRKKIAIKSI